MAAVFHRQVTLLRGEDAAQWFARTFAINGWSGAWRGEVYDWHHYHPNTHEVLGVPVGQARLQLGGPMGEIATISAGDAIVLPAGLAHCVLDATEDFFVIGAYPGGARPDLIRGFGGFAPAPMAVNCDPVLGPGKGFAVSR